MQKKTISLNFIIVAVLLLFVLGNQFITLIVDYMWFDALGYKQIFLIPLYTRITLFAIFFVLMLWDCGGKK